MERIAALDLGTQTGWAFCDGNEIRHGVFNLGDSGESRGAIGERLLIHIFGICDTLHPDMILIEEPHNSPRDGLPAIRIMNGLQMIGETACRLKKTPMRMVSISDWKKHLFGYVWKRTVVDGEKVDHRVTDKMTLEKLNSQNPRLQVRSPDAAVAVAIVMMARSQIESGGLKPSPRNRPKPPKRRKTARRAKK